jgi:hypothetical protein
MLASLRAAISSFQVIDCGKNQVAGFIDIIVFSRHQWGFGGGKFIMIWIAFFFQEKGVVVLM